MFGILLIASLYGQGLTILSYGDSFITAFPENLAYFYPFTSRSLRVTALHQNTSFTVFYNNKRITKSNMMNGATTTVTFPKTAEVNVLDYSANSIRITSTNNIVVYSLSQTITSDTLEKSIQTSVIQPITNLGTHHLIPSLSHSDLIQAFGGTPSSFPPERYSSFKLMIINAEDVENTVTIVKYEEEREEEVTLKIPSYQLIQIQANDSLLMVTSSHKVSLMLTHPCFQVTTCKCKMIMHQILPIEFQGQNFVVPYIAGINQRHLLMTSEDKSTSLYHNNVPLQPGPAGFFSLSDQTVNQYVTASGIVSLTLISPGVFIELIPENMFAACYLLQFYLDVKEALVIAETDSTNNVHTQYTHITFTKWTEIPGTKYSSTIIPLVNPSTYIWHSSSKIAVYILNRKDMTVYGGPAIPINEEPDEFGCMLTPAEYEVRDEYLSWTESLSLCTNLQKHLACPSSEDSQMNLAHAFNTTEDEDVSDWTIINTTEDEDVWIGLRRSLMTKEWYWQRQSPSSSLPSLSLGYIHWADGQPLDIDNGFCASLSLDPDDDFKWKSAKCCEKKHPICYKPTTYLNPLYLDDVVNIL